MTQGDLTDIKISTAVRSQQVRSTMRQLILEVWEGAYQ